MYIRSIGIAALIFGILFKVMHWPGANIQLLLGMTGCAVWFLVPQPRKLANT